MEIPILIETGEYVVIYVETHSTEAGEYMIPIFTKPGEYKPIYGVYSFLRKPDYQQPFMEGLCAESILTKTGESGGFIVQQLMRKIVFNDFSVL